MKALFSTLISFLFMAQMAIGQTITTDKLDYPPGSTAIITGTGFQANETVTLQVLHILADGNNSTEPQHQPWTVTADGDGNVSSTWDLDEDALGATFKLTADGLASGRHAETTFTDGNISISLISPNSVCAGSQITISYSTGNGSNAPAVPITAQLSNILGSFASPTNLSPTISTLATSGTQNLIVTIPSNIAVGSGYLIRMVSPTSSPTSISNSVSLTINSGIATQPLSTTITYGANTSLQLELVELPTNGWKMEHSS